MTNTMKADPNLTVEDQFKPEPLAPADIRKSWFHWYALAEVSNSFERLQSLSFCAAMIPILKKLYKRPEDLSAALKRHLTFFNTQGTWGSVIHGITIAMEEQKANGADIPDEAITGIKTGLMGPFAGIGDTLDWGILKPIVIGLCIPLGMAGSPLAPILMITIFLAITMYTGYFLWKTGYRLGRESISHLLESGWIHQLITGAGVLGMFMMGALSATFVKVSTPFEIVLKNSNPIQLQAMLDKIAPGLLPLATVFGVYWFLQKKGPKYVQLLLILLAISAVGAILGIL